MREGPRGRSHGQPRPQADQAALAAEPRVDAGPGVRNAEACASLHPLLEGRKGHESHLSTGREGVVPPSRPGWNAVGGRHPPPWVQRALLLLLLGRLLLRHVRISPPPVRAFVRRHDPYFFFFLAAFFFAIGSLTPFRWGFRRSRASVAHRLVAQMLGQLPA